MTLLTLCVWRWDLCARRWDLCARRNDLCDRRTQAAGQRYIFMFMTTFNVLCSWRRGRKHRPPGLHPPPPPFVLFAIEPETTVHWFQNRKELLETSNEVAITRLWQGVVWVWVWDRLYMLRLFAGLGHLFIVCQREGHHVTENLEHVFRSLSTTLHSYTFHSHFSFGEYRFAYLPATALQRWQFYFPCPIVLFSLS